MTHRSTITLALIVSLPWAMGSCRGVQTPAEQEIPQVALPVQGFSAVEEPPFVVIGAGDEAAVGELATGVIRPAAAALRRDFFDADPGADLQIWLFPDAHSRERHAPSVVAHHDAGRDGYYSVADHVIVATLSAGEQSPLHYLVHAYMRTNLPACPVWYDEGLGTLFEVSAVEDGHLVGRVDGRLPGLQQAIRGGELPDLATLAGLSAPEFHGPGHELHAGMARYLCYYLQQHDLLPSFHRQLLANTADDPDGSRTLLTVLGEDELAAFQERWQRWTLALVAEG
jgi:hypothetical protein